MRLLVEKLLDQMMDNANCMCNCKEYKEICSSGRITRNCQACKTYPELFKKAIKKIEEEMYAK